MKSIRLRRPTSPPKLRVDVIIRTRTPAPLTLAKWDSKSRSFTFMPDVEPTRHEVDNLIDQMLEAISNVVGVKRS